MATITIIEPHTPDVHAIAFDPKAESDAPPMVDFGAYLYHQTRATKKEIKWPYEWLRYTAASGKLDYIVVREYDTGKCEFRAMRDDGEMLLMWYDNAAVALRRAYASFIPSRVTRHVLVRMR